MNTPDGLVLRMTTAIATEIDAIAKAYADCVRELPQVLKVAVERSEPEYRIYTVIQAPPEDFDESRPLYQAELEVLRERPLLPLEFIVINANTEELRALPPESIGAHTDADRRVQVLFDRRLTDRTLPSE